MRDYGIVTGVRLPRPQFNKLTYMAATLNVSRNKMLGMLIDGAEIKQTPVLSVEVKNSNTGSDLRNPTGVAGV